MVMKIDTSTAVILSQIPLGVACILVLFEVYRFRKLLEKILGVIEKKYEIRER